MSHQGVRHYFVQHPAHSIGETLMDKVWRFLRFGKPDRQDGRRRVDPCLPYGHWAAGWEPVTMPGHKNPVRK